jgi:hypothetical protein
MTNENLLLKELPPPQHGGSIRPGSRRRIETALRDAQALELRLAGYDYETIRSHLQFKSVSSAYDAVQRCLKRNTEKAVEEYRLEQDARLDAMLKGLWSRARAGAEGVVDRVIRIEERRARLHGLDRQVHKVEHSAADDLLAALADLDAKMRREVADALSEEGSDG